MDSHELQALIKTARRKPLWVANGDSRKVSIARAGIERLIPHRVPFLFVDEITDISLEQQAIRGTRHVSKDDPVFRGHFPGDPIYPGVLQLEMIGQLGLCLMHFLISGETEISDGAPPQNIRALKVHEARFLAPIGPGSDLTIISQAVSWNDYTGICAGQVLRGDTICSCCLLEVYFVGQ